METTSSNQVTERRCTPEFKTRVVLELISGAKTPGEVCRQHNLKPQVVSSWTKPLRYSRDDHELREAVREAASAWPTYGSRRVSAQLRRQGFVVNRKRMYRKKRRTTNSDHPFPRYANLVHELEVVRPDQVWVSDITYVRLSKEFVYLPVIPSAALRADYGRVHPLHSSRN